MNKRQFFKKKIQDVTYSIWENEFKLAKSRQIREGIRQDRERQVENMSQFEAQIAGTKDKEVIKKLEAERETAKANAERFEAQMKMLDDQINGAEGTETSQMVIGVVETIKSLTELREMYKQYLRSI